MQFAKWENEREWRSRGRDAQVATLFSFPRDRLPWNNSARNLPILSRFHFSLQLHHRPAKRRFTAGKIIPPLRFMPTGAETKAVAAAPRARKRVYSFCIALWTGFAHGGANTSILSWEYFFHAQRAAYPALPRSMREVQGPRLQFADTREIFRTLAFLRKSCIAMFYPAGIS